MASHETICKFNQSGFCKYQNHCRKQHIMDICPTPMCNNMSFRHPKVCKFFNNFKRCKFGELCAYLHGPEIQTEDGKISELEENLAQVKAEIRKVEATLLKLENIENRMRSVEDSNRRNNERIEEVNQTLDQKTFSEKTVQLEDLALNFNILMHSVDDLEKSSNHLTIT